MILSPPSNANEIRQALVSVLGDQLGSYSRPNLPDAPACWVGRSLPRGYKVIVASPVEPTVPAIELVIQRFPDYQIQARNSANRGIAEKWQFFLVFHDYRQDPRLAINSVMRSFNVVDFSHLPGTDLAPEQYQIQIEYYNRLKED